MEVQPGQLIALSPEKARPFVDKGKIFPLNPPYMSGWGDLVIPFNSDPKYHWWNSGQSIKQTIKELGMPDSVIRRYGCILPNKKTIH